jgi:eukaryotic-like serine/threonine-protein kinase
MRPAPSQSAPAARQTLGLTARVFLGTASIVAVVILAAFLITSASVRRAGEASAQRGLEQSADLVAQFLAGRSRSLLGGARVFVQGPYFRTLVTEQRRDDILDQAMEASEQLGADWVFITDARGVMLAKSDEPSASGVAMGTVPLVAGALQGLTASGFGVSRDSVLFQAVAVPIAAPAGAPIGVLVATRVVDSMLVRDVKAATSSDLVFYLGKPDGTRTVSVSTLGRSADVRAAVSLITDRGETRGGIQPDLRIGAVRYLAQGSTLTTAGGDVVGGFVVLRSRDAEMTGISSLRRSLAIAGVIGLFLSWLAAFAAARRIALPVRTLSAAVRRASEGAYDAEADGNLRAIGSGTEIRELGVAFSSLMADLRDKELLTGLTPMRVQTSAEPAADPRSGSRYAIGGGQSRGVPNVRMSLGLSIGSVLANRYLVEATLGSGGLGIVYKVRDRVIGESVALKVLRPDVIARDAAAGGSLAEELRVARRITHRNVVRLHDLGEADGITFLTMEFVDGASLATIIETRGALHPTAVLSIARQLLRALSAMHAEGVVHGDLKPANLLIGPNGVLKVSDFGLARATLRSQRDASPTAASPALPQIAGAVIGTPEYMAPEQLIGATPSASSDLYAAGVVLYECLRGATPFDAETRLTFIAHKLDVGSTPREQPAPRMLSRTTALESILARMMAPTPEGRPQSAAALTEELAALD